ncbi:MAG: deoxyguanosinetriphosphate triphosphohydrolase [Nitrospinae bacterium]|nr:deoxyguanosinetriphosphate triphosphohydrolase [Nitrospinota bacterium]
MYTPLETSEYESERLAPYAMKSKGTRGRRYSEQEHPYRTAFQRDRDRIIHSSAFRRLEYKTQVFVYHEGDYYRTRLTHTIEVAQISRSASRVLGLNEDLSEAIALAHDLGHPPFGHSGEKVLNELMKDHGGFEHNKQSLRIVDHIENRYPDFRGLNLTYEVREGMAKHVTEYDKPTYEEFQGTSPTLEAQIVDFSDAIAYNSHDLDDGITSEMIDMESLKEVRIWEENYKRINQGLNNFNSNILKYQTIRGIINQQVTDLVEQTRKNIDEYGIRSVDDVRNFGEKIASFSSEMRLMDRELKDFLKKNMYDHYRVIRMEDKAGRFIRELFMAYLKREGLLPPNVQKDLKIVEKERLICDYIAGMTDRYALQEYKKLFDPYERV